MSIQTRKHGQLPMPRGKCHPLARARSVENHGIRPLERLGEKPTPFLPQFG
jgi:hypothetical protein